MMTRKSRGQGLCRPHSLSLGCVLLLVTALGWWLFPSLSEASALTAVPAISGTAQVGQTLTEGHANWGFSPLWFAYQWEDCDTAGQHCDAIKGASAQTYVLSPSDLGHTLRVQETAFGWGGRVDATSAATALVSTPPRPTSPLSAAPPTAGRGSSVTTLMTLETSAVTDQTVTLIATSTSTSATGQPSGTLAFENL